MKLKDIVKAVPSDITTGVLKLKSGKEITFHDISELNAQYTMDFVETFDIKSNYFGERALIIWLAHN